MWQFCPDGFKQLWNPPNYQYISAAKARRQATQRPFSINEIFGVALALKLISPPADQEARFMDWGLSDIGDKVRPPPPLPQFT